MWKAFCQLRISEEAQNEKQTRKVDKIVSKNLIQTDTKLSIKKLTTKIISKTSSTPKKFKTKKILMEHGYNLMMEGGMSSSLTSLQYICLKIKYKLKVPKEGVVPWQPNLENHKELEHGLN